jgi:16S rRNA (guanine966-N2)-methyltransferase
MRITGGAYRSRPVKVPPGIIRPAMDRMRESMFGIHTSYYGTLEGFAFLDLFCGSGVVALEAASRGASLIVLVEKDLKKRKTIEENLQMATCPHQLHMMDVERFFSMAMRRAQQYQLIHLDPPFPMAGKFDCITRINEANLLSSDGTLTLHYPKEDTLMSEIGSLYCEDVRSYGQSQLAFYRKKT